MPRIKRSASDELGQRPIAGAPILPIQRPGLYQSLALADYHSTEAVAPGEYAVSSSDLRTAWALSLSHMYDQWIHYPQRAPREETRPMLLGRAAHHLLLGEQNFAGHFVAQPAEYCDAKTSEVKPWNNNATVCRDWHARQAMDGRSVIKQEELAKIAGMARELLLEPRVKEAGILAGLVESSGFVKDKEAGIWIKVRPDICAPEAGTYTDLKIVADITDRGLRRRIAESGYILQAGLVWEWADQIGLPFASFTLLFVESDRPFCVRLIPLEADDIARGRRLCRLLLRKVAKCIDRGTWPGPGQGELESLPLLATERERIDWALMGEDA
jgi:PDDEXK-like domain of unknown function (DUF3799)